jgi:putative chitinase
MQFEITPDLLRKVAGLKKVTAVMKGLAEHLPEVLEKFEINTLKRVAHFLAQIGHESDHFQTLREYASGSAYEGRKDLGNTRAGDGKRYRGRGAIQLTGRANYRKFGKLLEVDLEANPALAETPKISALTAGAYWNDRKLNQFADKDDITTITKRINGGLNGFAARKAMLARAKIALAAQAKDQIASIEEEISDNTDTA